MTSPNVDLRHALDRGGRDPDATAGTRAPQLGDVVSCYFPLDEDPNRPGIKPRPCLVLGSRRSTASGRWYVQLAYGTKQNLEHIRPGELALRDRTSHRAAGLHHPTKFVFRRIRSVPFIFAYFRADHGGRVILGSLLPEDLQRAERLCAAFQRRGVQPSPVRPTPAARYE